MNNLERIMQRAASAGGDPEMALSAILDGSAASGVSADQFAGNLLAALDALSRKMDKPPVPRLAPGVLTCQLDYEEFLAYVNNLPEEELERMEEDDFNALNSLMEDLARWPGMMEARYKKRQKAEYERREGFFIEAAIDRCYVVEDDAEGYMIKSNYTARAFPVQDTSSCNMQDTDKAKYLYADPLLRLCRRFIALASPEQIIAALDSIAASAK